MIRRFGVHQILEGGHEPCHEARLDLRRERTEQHAPQPSKAQAPATEAGTVDKLVFGEDIQSDQIFGGCVSRPRVAPTHQHFRNDMLQPPGKGVVRDPAVKAVIQDKVIVPIGSSFDDLQRRDQQTLNE